MTEGMLNIIKKVISMLTISVATIIPVKAETSSVSGNNNELICIDPGHQLKGNSGLEEIGPGSSKKKLKVSSGTRGVATKKYEYQLTLEVGLKLRDVLQKEGYHVFMVRETHDVDISNKERAIKTNNAGCSLYIRLHADGINNSSTQGASVLTSSPENPYTGCSKI